VQGTALAGILSGVSAPRRCGAFSKSPHLTNEINLYRLPYVELPAELAAKVEEAVEAEIKF
jgi:hypothetical protein